MGGRDVFHLGRGTLRLHVLFGLGHFGGNQRRRLGCHSLLCFFEMLRSYKTVVQAGSIFHELFMRPLLNQDPLLQHNNVVSFLNRRQPVRDHDGRPVLGGAVERCLHHFLATYVDGACCLVQDDDGWLFDNASCNSDSLALATAEMDTCIPTQSVIALQNFVNVRT